MRHSAFDGTLEQDLHCHPSLAAAPLLKLEGFHWAVAANTAASSASLTVASIHSITWWDSSVSLAVSTSFRASRHILVSTDENAGKSETYTTKGLRCPTSGKRAVRVPLEDDHH